jgi:hypothetical protein
MHRHVSSHTQAASVQWPNHEKDPDLNNLVTPLYWLKAQGHSCQTINFYLLCPPHPLRYNSAIILLFVVLLLYLWQHPKLRHCTQNTLSTSNRLSALSSDSTKVYKPFVTSNQYLHWLPTDTSYISKEEADSSPKIQSKSWRWLKKERFRQLPENCRTGH